jgi:thiol-disulfide isomerase/thioredoxin
MSEQENGEPKKTKNIIIILVVVAAILGIYYFNKPADVSQQKADEQKNDQVAVEGENNQNNDQKNEENKEGNSQNSNVSSISDIIKSVEVKTTTSQATTPDTPHKLTQAEAMALVNKLIVTNPVATITIQPKEAADKAISYVNKYIMPTGQEAKVSEIFPEKITFYKFLMDISSKKYPAYVSTDGKTLLSAQEYDLDKNPNTIDGKEYVSIDNGFQEVKGAEICKENGKPIVYFFGSESCPHCAWEKPIVKEAVNSFGSKIAYHENIDTDKDLDIFNKFNREGGIPTLIIGCKYFKLGSGENIGADKEKAAITLLIDNILK